MKATTVLCVAIAATAFAGPANAVFKCTTAKGVVYQDRPCREGSESDVTIVIPTGELAPKAYAVTEESTQAINPRADDRPAAKSASRTSGNSSSTASTRADRRNSESTAGGADTQSRIAPTVVEKAVPFTAEDARKTDPSAKYYATEGFRAGAETPAQMNCETPTGERRTFYLSNGKLTSI